MWKEGYKAKLEREEREKEMKRQREALQVGTLNIQVQMKQSKLTEEKEQEMCEASEMQKLWAAQEEEEQAVAMRKRVVAREERMKADAYKDIQMRQKAEEEAAEKEFDKDLVARVLARERKMSEVEEAEKTLAKKQAVEFTEALKLEMARKAASDEELERLQQEEMERQWQKRYKQWEKEEIARRSLMEDV